MLSTFQDLNALIRVCKTVLGQLGIGVRQPAAGMSSGEFERLTFGSMPLG